MHLSSRIPFSISLSATLLSTVLLLPGCSGPTEDVRIGFCKDLTAEMLGRPEGLKWTAVEQDSGRLKDLTVALSYSAGESATGKVVCVYEQGEGADYTMGDANPLDAYRTLPYRVSLNGQSLGGKELGDSTRATLLNKAKAFADTVKAGTRKAADAVKAGTRKAADELSKGAKQLSSEVEKVLNQQ